MYDGASEEDTDNDEEIIYQADVDVLDTRSLIST